MPDFVYERSLWQKGIKLVAGCDEVGRGCFAGPVVAGCVVFSPNTIYTLQGASLKGVKINDSKKLTPSQRTKAAVWIKRNALSWGIGETSAALINKIGIVKATNRAFRLAVRNTNSKIGYLLIDAFYIPFVIGLRRKNQKAIIKGDEKSVSIAAASIIAKVYRDNLMATLSKNHKVYGWEENKGYGTKKHREAIKKYGLTKYHRKQFVETYIKKSKIQKTNDKFRIINLENGDKMKIDDYKQQAKDLRFKGKNF